MTTLGDLVDSISSSLHSFSGLHEQVTWLTAAIPSTTATSVTVDSSDEVSRGLIEVGDELMYVSVADSNRLTLAPFGRGYRGTPASSHVVNSAVTVDPMFPRYEIKKAIDHCLTGLYPDLFQVKTSTDTYSVLSIGYSLASDVEKVLEVKAQKANDPLDFWQPVYQWRFDGASPESSGKVLNLLQPLEVGSTIKIVYAAQFEGFANDSTTFEQAGIPESYADLILYCVTARMIRFLDPARLQTTNVENLSRSQAVQVGDAGKIANQLYAMYQQRVAEERSKLLDQTPAQIHYTR